MRWDRFVTRQCSVQSSGRPEKYLKHEQVEIMHKQLPASVRETCILFIIHFILFYLYQLSICNLKSRISVEKEVCRAISFGKSSTSVCMG